MVKSLTVRELAEITIELEDLNNNREKELNDFINAQKKKQNENNLGAKQYIKNKQELINNTNNLIKRVNEAYEEMWIKKYGAINSCLYKE